MSNEKTAADRALFGIGAAQAPIKNATVDKPVEAVVNTRYLPGIYRSDKYMRIIKQLTYEHRKDSEGKVQKTYGTWARDDNMIIFRKGIETPLTESDVQLPAIQRLIDSKVIYRLG